MNLDNCFYLGYISMVTDHAQRLVIKVDSDDTEKFKKLESVLVQMHSSDQTPVPFFIRKVHKINGNQLTVELDKSQQLPDITQLKGKSVYLPLSYLEDLGEKGFYFHEIIGFDVEDDNHGWIGQVKDVYESAAHPVLSVIQNEKEILLPVIDQFLKKVDKKNKKIFISAPEGLIDLYLD